MKKEKRYGRTGAAGGMDSRVSGYGIGLLPVLVLFILAILPACRNHKEMAKETLVETHKEMERNTENKISYSRQFYNDSVTRYNTKLEMFPSNIIASMFHFTAETLFKVESDEARKNVKVDFGN